MFKTLSITFICALCISVFVQAQEQPVDPTRPLNFIGTASTQGEGAKTAIQLTSILISSERKVAIINGQSLAENQTLKGVGALVKKIEADAVTLQQNGKVWRVPLNNTAIRK